MTDRRLIIGQAIKSIFKRSLSDYILYLKLAVVGQLKKGELTQAKAKYGRLIIGQAIKSIFKRSPSDYILSPKLAVVSQLKKAS